MAREIIVTDVAKVPSGDFSLTVAFWLAVPANRIRPAPTFKSVVPDDTAVASWGTSTAERAALTSGTVLEVTRTIGQFAQGTTTAAIKTALESAYAADQATLNATAFGTKFVGANWDGTTWTLLP